MDLPNNPPRYNYRSLMDNYKNYKKKSKSNKLNKKNQELMEDDNNDNDIVPQDTYLFKYVSPMYSFSPPTYTKYNNFRYYWQHNNKQNNKNIINNHNNQIITDISIMTIHFTILTAFLMIGIFICVCMKKLF
jgi:uncharacterized protein YcaQ